MPLLFVEGSNAKDIAISLEYAMRSGSLVPGATLPPVRQLALELGRPADGAFVDFGHQNLQALRHAGVILGVRA